MFQRPSQGLIQNVKGELTMATNLSQEEIQRRLEEIRRKKESQENQ